METLRILVTGGAGFIGSHLVKTLVHRGHNVKVLDNLSTGSLDNLIEVLDSIEFIKGDIRDYNLVEETIRGTDVVIHLAALIDVAESIVKPDLYFDVNIKGTYNLVKASRDISVFLFVSSSAVYGEQMKLPISEDSPVNPKSPYAASKISGEAFVASFSDLYNYRPIIFRLFNVYGPKQSKAYAGVITEFLRRVSKGEAPVIFGDGTQSRDFVHVSDIVEAIILALENYKAKGIYNIGSGKAVTINELAEIILKLMDREDLKPFHAPPRPGDIRYSMANIAKAMNELGFKPKVNLLKGLQGLIGGKF
ncbi:MAG: NAD-dependent epimerase/dehydratase family protein [Infirmifilum sp.]